MVPSIALLDQWYDSLSQNFDDKEISLNGGEQTKIITKICISTIDSLKNIISLIDAENTLLIVDECHKIGRKKRRNANKRLACNSRIICNS